jgi:hypothetical protein
MIPRKREGWLARSHSMVGSTMTRAMSDLVRLMGKSD